MTREVTSKKNSTRKRSSVNFDSKDTQVLKKMASNFVQEQLNSVNVIRHPYT